MAPFVHCVNARWRPPGEPRDRQGAMQLASRNTPRDLVRHELSDSPRAEHIGPDMLGALAQEARNREVKDAITHHRKETEQHIANLETAFEQLGEQADAWR
jgi:ferritin-like metal-binding protein YciE